MIERIILAVILPLFYSAVSPAIQVTDLKCEYRVNPLGLDVASPRLSWILKSDRRLQKQTAYQILVAGSKKE